MFENHWALIVDDDAHSLIAIGALLRDLGIRYKRNTTGADVAEAALSMHPRPAFILLDLDLPYADTFDILETLQDQPALAAIPVIATADDDAQNLASRSRTAGFAAFLVKPLPRRGFSDLLERVLDGEDVW